MLRALSLPLFLCLATCGQGPDGPFAELDPAFDGVSDAGRTTRLYRSGQRLEIRWAEPVGGPPAVRGVHEIYDTVLGRVCAIDGEDPQRRCVPVAVEDDYPGEIGYLDANHQEPMLVVDDLECRRFAAATDPRLWALPRGRSSRRFVLDAARYVDHAWPPYGSGCTPDFEESWAHMCVRPLRQVDFGELVTTRDTILGVEDDRSGVIVAAASDGAVVPLAYGAEYFDAPLGIRCSAKDAACVPNTYFSTDRAPVLGGDVLLSGTQVGHAPQRWAHHSQTQTWALLAPGEGRNRTALHVLEEETAVHLPTALLGEGRIALRVRTTPDGRSIPITFHDRDLGRDCRPRSTVDGKWRCVVELPWTCQHVPAAFAPNGREQLRVWTGKEDACFGGPIWFPGSLAQGPVRWGISPDSHAHPAVPGRAVRFEGVPRMAKLPDRSWGPVWEAVEEVGPEVFAELRIVGGR